MSSRSSSLLLLRSRLVPLAAALWGLGLGGCATGDVAMLATIAGGEKIRVPLAKGGAVPTNEGGVQIDTANFTLNPDKKIVYVFKFTDSRRRALRSVRVDDVSDTAVAKLVDDAQPQLSPAGQWHRETEALEMSDPRLEWLGTISNSLRVFRFTLTLADGQTLVLHQGALYPAALKAAVRQALGQKY